MMKNPWKTVLALALVLPLTGCLRRTYSVQQAKPPAQVLTASLDELVKQTQARYDALNTMTASVDIIASTGGQRTGKVTQYTSLSGYVLMRKPADLRVILLVPVLHTRAIDMATDGKEFKMLIPPQNRAITGSNQLATPSPKPLENLRPAVFFDSLLIKGIEPGDLVAVTADERIYQPDPRKKDVVSEPDYDISIYRQKNGGFELQTRRVIHIGRADLLPYQQDIYDDDGRIATQAKYSNYQKFSNVDFPTKVNIRRPKDELSIDMTITKFTPNQEMENDQFEFKIPENYQVQKLP